MDGNNKIKASSFTRALGIIGDRTALIILEYAFLGVRRFSDWEKRTKIAKSTLTSRLNNLVKHGLMKKVAYQRKPVLHEYRLTEMGLDLYPSALVSWRWEEHWRRHRMAHPRNLYHESCSQSMMPVMICSHCKENVNSHDVDYQDGPGAGYDNRLAPRHTRRSKNTNAGLFEVCDIIGDRWAALILAMAFFRVRRFDDMLKEQKIASNILSERLERLVNAGLLARRKYQDRPPRYEYILTEIGMDLYPNIVTIMQWGDKWLADAGKAPLILKHKPCKQTLKADIVCNQCRQTLQPRDVHF